MKEKEEFDIENILNIDILQSYTEADYEEDYYDDGE